MTKKENKMNSMSCQINSSLALAGVLYGGVQEFCPGEEHYYNYSDINILYGTLGRPGGNRGGEGGDPQTLINCYY